MDFTPRTVAKAPEIVALIDAAMERKNAAQPGRTYLGASRLGEECHRKLYFEYTNAPKDKGFSGQTLRMFDMGHDGETRVAEYFRTAGFDLRTENKDGKQFGFYIAKDPATGQARIAGHADGIFAGGPPVLLYPCLWENKALGAKSWSDVKENGVKKSKPVYYSQMQMYMYQFAIHENPSVFTAINRDTGELFIELVPFDAAEVQKCINKGVNVVTARHENEVPRIASTETDWRCKWCDFKGHCWKNTVQMSVVNDPTNFNPFASVK